MWPPASPSRTPAWPGTPRKRSAPSATGSIPRCPLEKKISALRKEVETLDKEIDKAGNELAKEIVEVDHLSNDITRETATVASEEKKIRAVGEAISAATEKVVALRPPARRAG